MDTLVRRAVTPLRLFLVLTFGILVVFQTMSMPGQFAHMAKEEPDLAYLRWPLTAFALVEIVCIQVVIVCTWKLLAMVQQDRIFTPDAMRWVDLILGAVATAWTLLAGLFLYVGVNADDPGLPMLLTLLLLCGGTLGLLIAVLRTLLDQATTLRSDMDAVI
jgi:hypothetical protein